MELLPPILEELLNLGYTSSHCEGDRAKLGIIGSESLPKAGHRVGILIDHFCVFRHWDSRSILQESRYGMPFCAYFPENLNGVLRAARKDQVIRERFPIRHFRW